MSAIRHPGAGPEPVAAPAPWLRIPEVVADVEALRTRFSDPQLSIAEILCDAHPADATAFVCVDEDFTVERLTFGELSEQSRRLASALRAQGVGEGDRVGVLMAKSRQLPVVLVALWRLGAVHVPLFTAFAGPAIAQRLTGASAALVIADPDQLDKLDGIETEVIVAGQRLDTLMREHPLLPSSARVGSEGLFIQLYTSGTTGTPKGVGVPGFAVGAFLSYVRYGLDLRGDDVYWNAADPGWAYGLYYGIVAPLALGVPNVLLAGGFSAARTARAIDELGVTNFTASPTAYRAMKKEGVTLRRPLRVASSAGEPLTPDVVAWAPRALGIEVRDQWGQTEQGMGIVNAWNPALRRDVRPGSMGQALPGFTGGTAGDAIVLSVRESPLMWFRGYVDGPTQTRERFTPDAGWYLTGDVGRSEGSDFFFASRDDDVILAAGYRIAPFDIESVLTSQPGVVEAATVGRPDEVRGEVVEAFVVVDDTVPRDELTERLQRAVRTQYGAHAYPRRVHVVDALPKTPSGKVQRFVLRSLTEEELAAMAAG
ncbi:AMP-binding protein [Microbacterium sp. RD1]|uniref:AMP-binding protein n=1 Tax=Microbacterium sp. RD1 TaxID=3457313 RepID=UPI003FA57576